MVAGLIVALLLATIGWIGLGLLAIAAEDMLPKTIEPSRWFIWAIVLLIGVCSGLIASGIPYSHVRSKE